MNPESDENSNIRIVYHPEYSASYPTVSAENPQRVISIMKTLDKRYPVVKPSLCTEEDILLCHSEGLLAMEKNEPGRYNAARLAAGGAVRTAELALEGYIPFGVIRPPGHHASPDHNWGFCFFNNMAIAISKLIKEGKISGAVILDIDLHFGDGTDTIFRDNGSVKVINIDAPSPEGFIRDTEAALSGINTSDIIGISAGFDQYEKDWGGNLSTDDYYKIGEISGRFAREKTGGRIFGILEGGYYIPDLGKNLIALLDGIQK